ncbi:MAG: helix-hairpin-helix domain-containing protein [Dehalococcoidia bacterium]
MNKKQIALVVCIILVSMATIGALGLADNKIPINSLDDQQFHAELVAVDGIGDVLAERCVSYRREHGQIAVSELIAVNGIGPERLRAIKKRFKDD